VLEAEKDEAIYNWLPISDFHATLPGIDESAVRIPEA